MARYRCPSALTHCSSVQTVAGPSAPKKSNTTKKRTKPKPKAAPKRVTSPSGDTINVDDPEPVQDTYTKAMKEAVDRGKRMERTRLLKTRKASEIWVGNLHPSVKKEDLSKVFKQFGNIRLIQTRLMLRKMYASVEYEYPLSARNALMMNKKHLRNKPMAVVRESHELPEFKEVVEAQKNPPPEPPLLRKAAGYVKLWLTSQPTEIIDQ